VNAFLLSDFFFLLGGGSFLCSAGEWLSLQGAFDGLFYALRVCFLKEKRPYGEYLSSRQKRKRGMRFYKMLPFGGACLLLSSLLFALAA